MTNKIRDDESGRFTETYTRETFLEVIHSLGGSGSTMEVARGVAAQYDRAADEFYDTVYKKLRRMTEEEEITSRKVGNARLWSIEDGDE